jgi:hypothetical protein
MGARRGRSWTRGGGGVRGLIGVVKCYAHATQEPQRKRWRVPVFPPFPRGGRRDETRTRWMDKSVPPLWPLLCFRLRVPRKDETLTSGLRDLPCRRRSPGLGARIGFPLVEILICFFFKKMVVMMSEGVCFLCTNWHPLRFTYQLTVVVLLSQNKSATSNQPTIHLSQNKSAPAISHQPNKQAVGQGIAGLFV